MSPAGVKWVNVQICADRPRTASHNSRDTFLTYPKQRCMHMRGACYRRLAIPPTRELCVGKRAEFANSAEFRLFLPRCEVSLRCASEYRGVNSNFRGQTDPEYRTRRGTPVKPASGRLQKLVELLHERSFGAGSNTQFHRRVSIDGVMLTR